MELVVAAGAPGFDFADFEMPAREVLREMLPGHAELVTEFTRPA